MIFDCFLDAQKKKSLKIVNKWNSSPLQSKSCRLHVVRLVVCSLPQQPFGLTGVAQEPKGQ